MLAGVGVVGDRLGGMTGGVEALEEVCRSVLSEMHFKK